MIILPATAMSNSPVTFNGSVPQHYDDYLGPFLFEPFALDLLELSRKP